MATARRAPLDIRPPIGWPLLPVPDANGALTWPGLAQSVAQHLRKLLATQPGELLVLEGSGERHQYPGGPGAREQARRGDHAFQQAPLLGQVEGASELGVLSGGEVDGSTHVREARLPLKKTCPGNHLKTVHDHDHPAGQDEGQDPRHERTSRGKLLAEPVLDAVAGVLGEVMPKAWMIRVMATRTMPQTTSSKEVT